MQAEMFNALLLPIRLPVNANSSANLRFTRNPGSGPAAVVSLMSKVTLRRDREIYTPISPVNHTESNIPIVRDDRSHLVIIMSLLHPLLQMLIVQGIGVLNVSASAPPV